MAPTRFPSDRPLDLAALRATEFPIAARRIYLNHASDSPMPARTARAMAARVAVLQDPALEVGQRETFARLARERLGRLLNASPSQIAFLTNVADATATVANGMTWRAGDEIVLVAQEFASFVYPWRNLERLGVRTILVPKDGAATDLDRIEAALTPHTRAVAISHVEYQSGFRNDLVALGRLCRDRGLLFVVDASQSLGSIPVDAAAWQADVVVAVGYKWLMAMHGIAVLLVSEAAMDRIRPVAPGRLSVTGGWQSQDYTLDWYPDARRYQSGAPNWLGIVALAESLGLLEEIGFEESTHQAGTVIDRLVAGLQQQGVTLTSDLRPAHRSLIVSFTTGGTGRDAALASRLAAAGVVLSQRAFGLRLSAHFWNTDEEVDRVLDILDGTLPRDPG